MNVKVDADTRTFIRFWLVPLGIVLAGWAIYSSRTALIIIASALFLALALNGPVSWIATHLPGRSRVGGTAIAYSFVVVLLGMFATLVVPPIVEQTAKFIETIPAIADTAMTQYQGANGFIQKYHLEGQVQQGLDSIKNQASNVAAGAGTVVISSLGSAIGFFTALILMLVLSFLMLIEGPHVLRKLWELYDDKTQMEYHRTITYRMHNVITGYVVGQLTVSAIGATVMGLFVFIISMFFPAVPGNLALPAAAIYFMLSLIPMFGAMIAATLITLLLVLNHPVSALVFVIGFFIYQQIENNFVSPTIQSKRMELSALWILSAVTIGIYVFGLAGAIISIPIAGCLKIAFDEYIDHKKRLDSKSKQPLVRLAKKAAGKT